ncbi:hypothetical protein tloyanaT_20960 [Thalassotalea loyana]|uniref:Uncharacterized protein n=1 Tax=Thalassotalea loyana TaxID=280483 RepID=A0ABQ6HCX1_9GAMM|nr:hypothetical protein [Thalassotalea loyana]GLX85844.1 hypothetical protein tloyanaT_20960 [Thalassotalea loyana]
MEDIFLDVKKLKKVFANFSVLEAQKVEKNIKEAMNSLKLPSEKLLALMKEEGLSFEDFKAGERSQESSSSKTPRKLKAENQSFAIVGNKRDLLLVKGRAKQNYDTVISFEDLDDNQKEIAIKIVELDNQERGAI